MPFLEITDDAWAGILGGNLTGVFVSVQEVAASMVEVGHGGAVVVVTSNAAHVAIPGLAHYSGAKGGAAALVRSMAVELAPHDIRGKQSPPARSGPPPTPSGWTTLPS